MANEYYESLTDLEKRNYDQVYYGWAALLDDGTLIKEFKPDGSIVKLKEVDWERATEFWVIDLCGFDDIPALPVDKYLLNPVLKFDLPPSSQYIWYHTSTGFVGAGGPVSVGSMETTTTAGVDTGKYRHYATLLADGSIKINLEEYA